jgi:transposase
MEELEFDLYLETSAKTGENVEKLFIEVCKILYNEYIIMADSQKKKEEENKSKNKLGKEEEKEQKVSERCNC